MGGKHSFPSRWPLALGHWPDVLGLSQQSDITVIMRNYKNLEVWRESQNLAVQVYQMTSGFPSAEKYGLTQQLRRAAISISSNVAEGAGRNGDAEYRRFVNIAAGSASALECQILLAQRLGMVTAGDGKPVLELAMKVKKMLRAFGNTLGAKG